MRHHFIYTSAALIGALLSSASPALAAEVGPVSEVVATPATTTRSDAIVSQSSVNNQVGVHLLSLFVNRFNLEFERRISPQWSLLVAPKVGVGQLSNNEIAKIFGSSVGVELGGRWFVSGRALSGFFMQPSISYDHFFIDQGSADRTGLHAKVGYQWVIANRAFINLSGGAMYDIEWARGAVSSAWMRSADHSRGFTPDASFSIGVGF